MKSRHHAIVLPYHMSCHFHINNHHPSSGFVLQCLPRRWTKSARQTCSAPGLGSPDSDRTLKQPKCLPRPKVSSDSLHMCTEKIHRAYRAMDDSDAIHDSRCAAVQFNIFNILHVCVCPFFGFAFAELLGTACFSFMKQ